MKLEHEYLGQLAAYEKFCARVCEKYLIDRQTLDDFMTFGKHMRCLGEVIGRINREGTSTNLSLQAGTMAMMARRVFNHLGYRLTIAGTISREDFFRLIDHLNRDLGDPDYGEGFYPLHYRAREILGLVQNSMAAQANVIRELKASKTYGK